MLLKEAKEILKKNGYKLIEESADKMLISNVERQLEKMPYSGGISCFDEQDMEDVYNYLKSKGYTVEKLKDKIGAYGPEEHPRTFYRVSYSTDTPSNDTYKNWEKRDGFNPKFIDKEIKLKLEENPDEGTIEYFSQGACEAAYDKLKQLGYDVTYTSDRDVDDYVIHYVEYKKKVNEAMSKQNDVNRLNEGSYSDIELTDLEVKNGDLYATFDIVETEDSESFIKYYNIFPGDEFTSKVRFSDKGEPYVTGLNRANYRWYFNPEDSQKIRTAARSLRK